MLLLCFHNFIYFGHVVVVQEDVQELVESWHLLVLGGAVGLADTLLGVEVHAPAEGKLEKEKGDHYLGVDVQFGVLVGEVLGTLVYFVTDLTQFILDVVDCGRFGRICGLWS